MVHLKKIVYYSKVIKIFYMETHSTAEVLLEGYDPKVISLGVGSSEYQVALFTKRIKHLTQHLSTKKKDFACKYGLIKLVSKRSRMLKYIKSQSTERYKSLIAYLGLRK